jgi:hypothetical protein
MSVGFVLFLAWLTSAVHSMSVFFAMTGILMFIFGFIKCAIADDLIKRYFVIAICFWFIAALLPSKKDMQFILATTGVYAVVTSDPAKEIGGKVMMIINKKLDEMGETK